MKGILILIAVLLLMPMVVITQSPGDLQAEYNEWIEWQQVLDQEYKGLTLDYAEWAKLRAEHNAYWWKATTWQGYSYLFCDSNGETRTESWSWAIPIDLQCES